MPGEVSIVRGSLIHGTLVPNPMSYLHASLTVERDVLVPETHIHVS